MSQGNTTTSSQSSSPAQVQQQPPNQEQSIQEQGNALIEVPSLSKWQQLFQTLPPEVHTIITSHLDRVSQITLSLTSPYFHQIFREIYGANGTPYNIAHSPMSLQMQSSACGKYLLETTEDIFWHGDATGEWDRSLGDLLSGEKTLWGNLIFCGECCLYKPSSAYACFPYEEEMLSKYKKEVQAFEEEDMEWYESLCRKCRVKLLFVVLEKREEAFNWPCTEWNRKSMGVKKVDWKERTAREKCSELEDTETDWEYHAAEYCYERWEDIYERLGI